MGSNFFPLELFHSCLQYLFSAYYVPSSALSVKGITVGRTRHYPCLVGPSVSWQRQMSIKGLHEYIKLHLGRGREAEGCGALRSYYDGSCLVVLCASTVAIIEPLHYYANITDEGKEAQKGHMYSKHWSWIQIETF